MPNGHKRQARKRAEKRRREKRHRRDRHGKVAARQEPSARAWPAGGGEIVGAWATPELALAVSGRVTSVLAVRGRGDAGIIVYARASLLAGGYLGSMAASLQDGFETALPDYRANPVFAGERLEEVAPAEVSRLMWGMFAWSASRELLDPDEFHGPCFGFLPPPAGRPASWSRDLQSRLPPRLVPFADEVLPEMEEWDGAPSDRPDMPVLAALAFRSSRPLTLATEIDRSHLEFRASSDDRSEFDWYDPAEADLLALEHPPPLGRIILQPEGVDAIVVTAEAAAKLALRLRAIDGELTLLGARWKLLEVGTHLPSLADG